MLRAEVGDEVDFFVGRKSGFNRTIRGEVVEIYGARTKLPTYVVEDPTTTGGATRYEIDGYALRAVYPKGR